MDQIDNASLSQAGDVARGLLDLLATAALVTLAVAALVVAAILLNRLARRRLVERLAAPRLAQLRALNERYRQALGPEVDALAHLRQHVALPSKDAFDRYDPTAGLSAYLTNNAPSLAAVPAETWRAYAAEARAIVDNTPRPSVPWYLLWNADAPHEQATSQLREAELVHITWVWSYVSPKGRNRYIANRVFDAQDVYEALVASEERARHEASREHQRALMTPSLRFDILKRDGYRCQICGRTAAEGARLEVDHKVPVAAGGLTVPENLWTLCHDCNNGKSAKEL